MDVESVRLRILFVFFVAVLCYGIAQVAGFNPWTASLIGGWIATLVVIAEKGLEKTSVRKLIAGGIGVLIGVGLANLIGYPLLFIAYLKPFAPYLLLILNVIFASVTLTVFIRREEEIFGFLSRITGKEIPVPEGGPKILDTSVIIDGRIEGLCEAGFIEGTVLIPRFVLEELQQIADSSSPTRRVRGRRGLEIVTRLQSQGPIPVEVVDKDYPEIKEVDQKLIRLAKDLNAKIITNDYNLKKVANIQGIKILNINEAATALKPILLPGETLRVNIIKEGENPGQGVAYLDDGTMVVVEGGKDYIGREIEVIVTSVLQTTAGKMIFSEVREEMERVRRKGRVR